MAKELAAHSSISHYRIVSKIGAGGMGEVYLAQDTKLNRRVALKILPADVAAHLDRMKRFVQEAKAASALNHPNIITIHEIDETESGHFIATEFIEGETLRERLRRGQVKLSEVLEVSIQIASALAAAHGAGIVHRDIKPENTMLRRDGYVKVLDFGLAKLTEQELLDTEALTRDAINTEPGIVMGTAIYMSPEQARGLQVDARTDIFSLGVLIYEMVAGRLPFEGSNTYEIIASILSDKEAAFLARSACETPPELARIVAKALRKDREERYQNIKDLLLDLKRLKERLAFEAELERSAPANGFTSEKIGVSLLSETTAEAKALPTEGGGVIPHQGLGGEYLIGGVKSLKLAGLIALVVIAAGIVAGSLYLRTQPNPVSIESVAVLPFVNQDQDPNTEYLSDGIPESIINSLSQLPNLKVMSRNSAFHYKGRQLDTQAVAKELKVQAIVSGRIAQRGDVLSLSVELIRTQDNSQIWGQKYNLKLADVFAVQEEMAKEISEKLRLKLTGTERQLAKRPTDNIKAFQYYSQGRSCYSRRTHEDLLAAVRYYEKAIDEDHNYALAYSGLADAYGALGVRGYLDPIEGRRKEEEYARQALALDDNLAEAHQAFGLPKIVFAPYNFSQGDRELRRAIELSPSLAAAHQYLGHSLVEQGRLDEGLEQYMKARELDPLSPIIARNVATTYYAKRDYRRALELLQQANELGPPFTNPLEIGVYIQNGLFKETQVQLQKVKRERPNDPLLIYDTGMIFAAEGNRSEALQIAKELERMSGPSLSHAQYLARIYATLNEKELAFEWLERGLATGATPGLVKDDPVWDTIRNDSRFADLLRRMGIAS